MNDSPVALLVVDVRGWIHDLNFAEVDVSLVGIHVPEIEDDFVFIMTPLAVESFIWIAANFGCVPWNNANVNWTVRSFL